MATGLDSPDPTRKSFMEHLEDLRRTIMWSLLFLVIGMSLAVPSAPAVMRMIVAPLRLAGVANPDAFLRVFSVTGGFTVAMQVIFWTGLLFSAPLIVCAIGAYLLPALSGRERKMVATVFGFAICLFAVGVWLAYSMVLPMALAYLFKLSAWIGVTCEFVDISDFMKFTIQLLVCFGLAFEVPLIIVTLGAMGIVTSRQLIHYWRHAVVVMMIAAMVLTPGPDPVSMAMVAIPMIVLYGVCIAVVTCMERGRTRQKGCS